MNNPPKMANSNQPQTQLSGQSSVADTSPRSPNSTDGQHLGVQSHPPQQNQTQPSGQYQGQQGPQPSGQMPSSQPQPIAQIATHNQTPMQQSNPRPGLSSPRIVLKEKPEPNPDMDTKICVYKVTKWIQFIFVILECIYQLVILLQWNSETETEKERKRRLFRQTEWYKLLQIELDVIMYVTFFYYLVNDVVGATASVLQNFCCQFAHFIQTIVHLYRDFCFTEFMHFTIVLIVTMFMSLHWHHLNRSTKSLEQIYP